MLKAKSLLQIGLLLSSNLVFAAPTIVYGPKVVEVPTTDSGVSTPQCLVRVNTKGKVFSSFFADFEKKTNQCPSDPNVYMKARDNGAFKSGVAKVEGAKGDSVLVDGVAHKYRSEEFAGVIAIPGKKNGDKIVSWIPYCVPALIPVGKEGQTKDKDETIVCKRESPADEIKSENIDKELEENTIKCSGAKKCGESAFTLMPVAKYVASKSKPHSNNAVAGTGNIPNEVSDKNSVVSTDGNKRSVEGGSTRPVVQAPMK